MKLQLFAILRRDINLHRGAEYIDIQNQRRLSASAFDIAFRPHERTEFYFDELPDLVDFRSLHEWSAAQSVHYLTQLMYHQARRKHRYCLHNEIGLQYRKALVEIQFRG